MADKETQQDLPERPEPQQAVSEIADRVRSSADYTQQAFDNGLSTASGVIKTIAAQARSQYGDINRRSQSILETASSHSEATYGAFVTKLKEALGLALEHSTVTYTMGTGLVLVALPGPRRFLWRQTLGRLRSEEVRLAVADALFKSAEVKSAHLKQSIAAQRAEADKLLERLAAAQEQYRAGLSKLSATNRQLQSLQSSVLSAEKNAEKLIRDLRELPSSQALKLRAEVALAKAAAQQQSTALDKQIYNLSSQGF